MRFPLSSPPSYTRVGDTENLDEHRTGFLEDGGQLSSEAKQKYRSHALRAWHWRVLLEAALLGCSAVLLAATLRQGCHLIGREYDRGQLSKQWRRIFFARDNVRAPLNRFIVPDAADGVEYEVQRFKGSFGLKSPFTGVGPDVDAAWDNITDGPIGGAIGITKDQWEAVNEYPEFHVMIEQDHGSGKYLASLDVFHQLHCVDLLRKNIHSEYYDENEGSFAGASPRVIEGHLEHCVETLRQTLMCHGDISLLTYKWVKGREIPYPNFNTVHTCKKWETLVEWNMKRDVSVEWVDGERRMCSIHR